MNGIHLDLVNYEMYYFAVLFVFLISVLSSCVLWSSAALLLGISVSPLYLRGGGASKWNAKPNTKDQAQWNKSRTISKQTNKQTGSLSDWVRDGVHYIFQFHRESYRNAVQLLSNESVALSQQHSVVQFDRWPRLFCQWPPINHRTFEQRPDSSLLLMLFPRKREMIRIK